MKRRKWLTEAQISQEYFLTRQNIRWAVRNGEIPEGEFVEKDTGELLISRSAAERLWGRRKQGRQAVKDAIEHGQT